MIEGMKTNRKNVGLRLLLPLCLLPSGALAQQSPPAPATPAPTLAQALGAMPAASVGDGAVALTVGAEGVRPAPLPPPSETDAGLPENPIATPQSIAARYGRMGGWFGHVYALAPPTMTVLNTSPALADLPLGDLAGQHPETYLLGSLTPEQLRQVGVGGLAYADMTPDQQSLMRALLPAPLEIIPAAATLPDRKYGTQQAQDERAAFDAQIKELSGDGVFGALRLHAYLTSDFYAHAPKGFGIGDTRGTLETTGAYKLPFGGYSNMDSRGKGMEAILRADVPNALKEGDFNWKRQDLDKPVTLPGVKTVDDLVARLAPATGLELYADTHYGRLDVLVAGDLKKPQPAADVMQALAVCVCGAWRQVGPAYVLTDDVQGLGFRQQFLAEIAEVWSNRLSQGGKDAGGHLQELDWLHTLSFAPGDIGALSEDQINAIHKEAGTNKGHLPWKALPPALRQYLRGQFAQKGDSDLKDGNSEIVKMGEDMKAGAQSVTPDTIVDTALNIRLAVELPGTGAMMLYDDYKVQAPEPDTGSKPAKADALTQGNSVIVPQKLRGILCAPETPDEARAAVAHLPKLGLNALFLDVFTNGRTYFLNSALPPENDKAAGVLQAALDAARPLHIPVYAVLDALCWRKDGLSPRPQSWPAGYEEDLTISGETPDRAIQRRYAANSLSTIYDHPQYALEEEGGQGWASPLDPKVRALLPPLVRTLAATPGLAGLVFQDTEPPGYSDGDMDEDRIGLGYAPENRLAYLRQHHRDPVDLSSGSDMVFVSAGLGNFFKGYPIAIPSFASRSGDHFAWSKYRTDAALALAADCWRAAKTTVPALPLLLRQGTFGREFDPWTDPKQVDPPRAGREDMIASLMKFRPQEIISIKYGPPEQADPSRFTAYAARLADENEKQAGGAIFDLVTGGPPSSLVDTLDRLAALLKKPARP